MRSLILPLLSLAVLVPAEVLAQPGPVEFQVTKINRTLISSPQYSYTGAQQYRTDQNVRWLEVEVEFTALPEVTDELTVKYYILVNGTILTGEVTHMNVMAGKEKRSVMYIPPNAFARLLGNRPVTINAIQNIAIQISQKGTVKSELSLARAPAQWYTTGPTVSGLVFNKNDTPFAPLYWDRYEQIKASSH